MSFPYSQETETRMQELYNRLPEKNRRLYTGVEASKLGRGGVSYIASLFNCSRNTILRGIKELGEEDVMENRNRETGGGRCPVLVKTPDINAIFLIGVPLKRLDGKKESLETLH